MRAVRVFVAARELIVLSFEIMSVLGLWTGGRRGRKRDKRVPHVLAIQRSLYYPY